MGIPGQSEARFVDFIGEGGRGKGGAWFCKSDFNEILALSKMQEGDRPLGQIRAFREVTLKIGLVDLGLLGGSFT